MLGLRFNGRLLIPIDSLRTGDPKMECHMREALGLNYSNSKFPKHMFATQKINSLQIRVAFPEIVFEWTSAKWLNDPHALELSGKWTIHGVSLPSKTILSVTQSSTSPPVFHVKGDVPSHSKILGLL